MRPTSLSGAAGLTCTLPCGQKGFEKTADLNTVVGVCGNKKKTPSKFMEYIYNGTNNVRLT